MRLTYSALPLLALCQFASASPCKPSSIESTLTSESATIPSTATVESETASASQSTTTLDTESTTAVDVESTTTLNAESATTLDVQSTTTLEVETATSNNGLPTTTTTTSVAQPTNVLINPGFEDTTTSPWELVAAGFGTVGLSTTEKHGGAQSGFFSASVGGPANLGVKQIIDRALIQVGKPYILTAHVNTKTASNCFSQLIVCNNGAGYFASKSFGAPFGTWTPVTLTCTWDQARWDAGPSIDIRGICQTIEFYVDDVSLIEDVSE
ncbi:hypothetical protein F53441_8025 [Fusarium austroafricanum]|uniref:CBM-cenC domain-containing protein n=1 Tax=Fusarium austroafricanum TaxID=2364996 RepID=A0A8H4NXT7_9HYPO|nr:hypothetical protein F53441_8025 [Fusarium austroafricanum]